jgi:hypothetical protein
MASLLRTAALLALSWLPGLQMALADAPEFEAQVARKFATIDAWQAVAVDGDHFYAINNRSITKHDKLTGEPVLQWDGGAAAANTLLHLDSGYVLNGKLYAAHSNYPAWPMTSSIEIWNTETMEHIDTHSFGIALGSMTWLDRHDGFWWGTFANYDIVQAGMDHPYGESRNTQVVKMNDEFTILERWLIPPQLMARMIPMSNSGGSWGADGYLYLTGHDYPEVYVMELPAAGSQLDWIATVQVPELNGQGIAWDRSTQEPVLWTILRRTREVFQVNMPEIIIPE